MPMLILSLMTHGMMHGVMHGMMHLLLRFVQDFGVKLGRDFVKILPRKFAGVADQIQLLDR